MTPRLNDTSHHVAPANQRGITLIISMVFLLLLSLISLATMRNTTLQQSMANNLHNRLIAFQAAEAALRDGEQTVMALDSPPVAVKTDPEDDEVWQHNKFQWDKASWWQRYGVPHNLEIPDNDSQPLLKQSMANPQYVIEYIGFVPDTPEIGQHYGASTGRHFYRITACGKGYSGDAIVILQSTVATRFD